MPNRYSSAGLPTVGLMPATFQGAVFTPKQADLSLLARSLDKIEERQLATSQQQTAIAKAIGDLDMNAAEDAWKTNYANTVQDQIRALIDVGDFSNAMNSAVRLAGDVYTNPAIKGRIRAQEEYKKFVDETQRRTDIDQRTKNWALATNPYSYQDVRDDKGNIVGGSEWKPDNRPVGQIDLAKLGSLALSWVKPEKSSGNSAVFVDANGNFTKSLANAVDVAYQTSSGVEYLGKDKLREAINAAIDMTPGGRAAIEQDYKVAEWEYNNLTPEQKDTIGETEFTDSNGRPLTREEFLAKKINPWADAASYKHSESKTSYGSGLSTRLQLKQQAAANAAAANGGLNDLGKNGVNYTSTGYNITYSTSDYLASAQGKIEDAIKRIEGAMPAVTRTPQWRKAKAMGDYSKLESIVRNTPMKDGKNYFNATSKDAQRIANEALRAINNNYSFVVDNFKGMNKLTKDAILFKSSIDAGQSLPNDNRYSRQFYKYLGEISDGKPAESYRITFNSDNDVDDFLKKMGMNRATAENNGIEFGHNNDFQTVTIKQNSGILPKAVMTFYSSNDNLLSLPWNRSKITALDGEGRDIGSSKRGNILSSLSGLQRTTNKFRGLDDYTSAHVASFNNKSGTTRSTDQLKVGDIPAIANAAREYGIGSAEYDRTVKNIKASLSNRLAGSDWNQFQLYGYDEDTRGLTIMPSGDDKDKKIAKAISYLGSEDAIVQFATNGMQHGYYITIPQEKDKYGNPYEKSKAETFFIASGVEDEAMNEFITDSNTRAISEYNRRRSTAGNYRTYTGDNITNIGNSQAMLNGIPVSRELAVQKIEQDKLIDDFVSGIKYGQIPVRNEEELNSAISQAIQYIVAETKVTSQDEAVNIANIIMNKIK